MPNTPQPKSDETRDISSTENSPRTSVYLAVSLLVIGVLPWRVGKYFSGQLDPVVLGKVGLLLAALLIVLLARGSVTRSGRAINSATAPTILLLLMYFGTSSMGAYLSGNLLATAELSIRALTVGFVVLVLIEIVEPMDLIEILSRVLAAVAIFLSATGTLNGDNLSGRLSGSFPPTHPNELAFIAAVPLTYFVWRTVNIDSSGIRNLAMVALGVIVYLTQSRTSAGVTALVCFFIVIRGTRDWRLRLSIVTWAILSILCTITFSNAIQDFASRGGTVSVNTLNSRQFAWSAALFSDRAVTQLLFGEGLAKKLVAVTGQYWKTQVIDSSWVGAFVQAGLIGVGLAAVLVLYAALQARRNIRPANELWLALLLLVVARSIFESGLLDSSSSFLIFMMVSLGAATSRHSALSRSAGANYWEPYLRLVDRSRRRTFDAPEAIR